MQKTPQDALKRLVRAGLTSAEIDIGEPPEVFRGALSYSACTLAGTFMSRMSKQQLTSLDGVSTRKAPDPEARQRRA